MNVYPTPISEAKNDLPTIKTIDMWMIRDSGRIYFEIAKGIIRTTPVVQIDGDLITTQSGSVYRLGTMDPLVKLRLPSRHLSDVNPLTPFTIKAIALVASLIYGSTELM